jgi:hypothetical protein
MFAFPEQEKSETLKLLNAKLARNFSSALKAATITATATSFNEEIQHTKEARAERK